jgi:hypothetical protein
MDPAGKRQRRSTHTTRAEKAFAAVLAMAAVSITAVLITSFFVISSFYLDADVDHDVIKGLIKDTLETINENIK